MVCRGLPPLDCCQHVFYSAQLGHAKPHAAFFQGVQRGLNLSGNEILLVGDDEVCDLVGARDAGWQALADQPERI